MRLNHSKLALGVPLLLGVALVSCNGDRAEVPSSDADTANAAPTAAEAQITSETPVEVDWRYCDMSLFPVPPPDMPQIPVDAEGCRIGDQRIQAWPMEDGTIEIYFVRGRRSPQTMGIGDTEGYWVAAKSRGCDPDGPGEEGFYRVDSVNVWVDQADDQRFIQVPQGDVSLSAIEAPADEGEVIGGFLFLGAGGCDQIDTDRVF